MIPEYFLVLVLMIGTPQQEILVLERAPTLSWCKKWADARQEFAPTAGRFGCLTSQTPTPI